ncbi:CBS domain-containing protein [Actinobacteria bacterium YIM 96077]|uniref:Zinc metalloprotease n=1 Tax=Phytoactinopolyspora halophila TaxID=1981511 RepID=A0A329R1U7_9ACTN|nr:site-2 protease family protein [Phytoactinopolyspora halophila]AYY13313.1 CBS domain-containing protein [Actinobacteria bacterium YIM 96077]RAW17452.1 site-2 protease family protein [Phytoactinopolyspora halophila]
MVSGWRNIPLGRLRGIPVYVSPTWFIVAAVITVGFEPFVARSLRDLGAGAYAVTFAFAVLLYVSVLLHELSHALTARAFGLPVRGITLHFLGGHTEIERDSPTPGRDLLVSAAGPALSLVLGAAAYLAAMPVTAPIPEYLLLVLAAANGIVGFFNLLPALPLDGGHMLRAAVWRISGDEQRGTVVAARAGQVLAGLVLLVPFVVGDGPTTFGIVWAALVAMLLWTGATQALATGRMRARIPRLGARELARRAVPVSADQPVSEALRAARERGASSMVVVDARDRPTGVVNLTALSALPEERRPWVSVASVARTVSDGMTLGVDIAGTELLAAMRSAPVPEYLVLDHDGTVYGVLAAADVDAALSAKGSGTR